MDRGLSASVRLVLFAAAAFLYSAASFAQVKVLMSGGFAAAYREVLPEFERTTGIAVTTSSGASQGTGPDTIAAQLRRGAQADVVILSKEGLADLIAEGRIVAGSEVDLAQTPIGVSVRTGAPKPDISTVEAFTQTLLRAKTIAMPGSTTGIYLTGTLLPRLGVADKILVKLSSRGAESAKLVADGSAALAVQPVSELLNVPGLEFVGTIPADIQYISIFSAAVVSGSTETDRARRLIAFLASDIAVSAIKRSGMEPKRRPNR